MKGGPQHDERPGSERAGGQKARHVAQRDAAGGGIRQVGRHQRVLGVDHVLAADEAIAGRQVRRRRPKRQIGGEHAGRAGRGDEPDLRARRRVEERARLSRRELLVGLVAGRGRRALDVPLVRGQIQRHAVAGQRVLADPRAQRAPRAVALVEHVDPVAALHVLGEQHHRARLRGRSGQRRVLHRRAHHVRRHLHRPAVAGHAQAARAQRGHALRVAGGVRDRRLRLSRLEAEGYGAEHAECPANDTDECKTKNRRIAVGVRAK